MVDIRKISRRAFIGRSLKRIEDGDPYVKWELWQESPNTAVRVELSVGGWPHPEIALGFAKVNWPDKWDEKEGQRIALSKAIATIWRRVMNTPIFEG